MPNKINESDWLYRLVRPAHYQNGELSLDAFDDKYDAQSFNLVSISSPRATLEKFAPFDGTRKKCKKKTGDADPTFLEMYEAGYRVAVVSVLSIRKLGLVFKRSEEGDEYNPKTAHVNVIDAKSKAELLLDHAHVLSRKETISGFYPPTSTETDAH